MMYVIIFSYDFEYWGIYFAIDQSELGSYLSPTSIGVIMEFCMDVAPLNETIAPILMMCPREIKSYPKKDLLKYQQQIAAERIEKFIEIFPPLHDVHAFTFFFA